MKKPGAAIVTVTVLLLAGTAAGQTNVVKYHATINDVKYVYATVQPVGRLKSGDILEANTLDAFGNAIGGEEVSATKAGAGCGAAGGWVRY